MSFLICEVSLSHLSALPSHSSPLIGYCYYQVTRWEGSGVNEGSEQPKVTPGGEGGPRSIPPPLATLPCGPTLLSECPSQGSQGLKTRSKLHKDSGDRRRTVWRQARGGPRRRPGRDEGGRDGGGRT